MPKLRSASPGGRRKRQARESQRKSRARRRADVEILHERVRSLTQALETTTGACLQLSDALTSTSNRNWNHEFVRSTLQPFLAQVVFAASILEQDEDSEEHISPPFEQEDQIRRSVAVHSSVKVTSPQPTDHASSNVALRSYWNASAGGMSPRLTYGLWPAAEPSSLSPPLDIAIYLFMPESSSMPFHIALYWSALCHAYTSLTHSTSLVYRELFQYMLLFSSRGDVIDRIQRRLQFKPAAVSLVAIDIQETLKLPANTQIDVASSINESNDISEEASQLTLHHSLIKQAMLQHGDTIDNYLDSIAVEQYLHSTWQITTSPTTVASESDATSAPLDIQLSEHAMQRMIRRLAQSSRCLGDRIGFPVHMIDTLALDYLYTPALP